MYRLRQIIEKKNDFPYHFIKISVRYKKIGYNINVLRQTTCLAVNPIKVNRLQNVRPAGDLLYGNCDVCDGVFLCCPFSLEVSWMRS